MSRLYLIGGLLATLLVSGCSSTKELTPITDRTGFMRNYALLRGGAETEPLFVYRHPNANLHIFNQAILEPIEIWRGEESRLGDADKGRAQHVADYFYTLLYTRLARDFEMVTESGPKALRMRVAVTKLEEKKTQLDITSTDKAQPNLVQQFKKMAETPPDFVGRAGIEVEIVDALTGEVRYAAIERRSAVGADGEMNTWDDLGKYLQFTVERIGYRLCVERGMENCVRPPDPFAPQGG